MSSCDRSLHERMGSSSAGLMRQDDGHRQEKRPEKFDYIDAEFSADCQKEEALEKQREGQAKYIAHLKPLESVWWIVGYTDLGVIDPKTKLQLHSVTICQSEGAHFMGSKMTAGRPTDDDVITALQVAMAFPTVGQGKRPAGLCVAWRLKDMWEQLQNWCKGMQIHPRLQTREEAVDGCAAQGTDIMGRNNPDPITIPEPSLSEKLNQEGNDYFAQRQYAKAAERYTKALAEDPNSAVAYSNRAITYLNMGLHTKALAEAEEAIRLDPSYAKAHARKGTALEKLGRVSDARAHYQQCIASLKPNSQFEEALKKLEASQASPNSVQKH